MCVAGARPGWLTVCEGEDLQSSIRPHLQRSWPGLLGGNDLVQVRRPGDRKRCGLAILPDGERAGSARNDVDVLGVVVQPDAGIVAVGGGTLVIENPRAAQREAVVGLGRRVDESRDALVVFACAT